MDYRPHECFSLDAVRAVNHPTTEKAVTGLNSCNGFFEDSERRRQRLSAPTHPASVSFAVGLSFESFRRSACYASIGGSFLPAPFTSVVPEEFPRFTAAEVLCHTCGSLLTQSKLGGLRPVSTAWQGRQSPAQPVPGTDGTQGKHRDDQANVEQCV